MYFIAVLIFMGVILVNVSMGMGGLIYIIDIVSLILILLLTIPMITGVGLMKDFLKAFSLISGKSAGADQVQIRRSAEAVGLTSKLVLCAGAVSSLIGGITCLAIVDPAKLGPNVSVAIISLLYSVMLEMVLLPVQSKLRLMLKRDETGRNENRRRK